MSAEVQSDTEWLRACAALDGLTELEKLSEHAVDLDAEPFVPEGWSVVEHHRGGTIDLATAKLGLYLAEAQKKGRIGGEALRVRLADQPVLNANVLDFLLKKENQHLIPEEWKGPAVFFWGTVYRGGVGRLCVRCLCWGGGRWHWHCSWLAYEWRSDNPAAVVASNA